MTLEDEFQKPVRDRLAAIVIPTALEIDMRCDWQLDVLVPRTNYDGWMKEAQSFQDAQLAAHENAMHEITHAPDVGVLSGQFPSPAPRKRSRTRKKK
jgi:hypothetical protein